MEQKNMSVEDVLKEIEGLSHSQGFYGRLYRDLVELKKEGGSQWEEFKRQIEEAELKDVVDMVIFFEE